MNLIRPAYLFAVGCLPLVGCLATQEPLPESVPSPPAGVLQPTDPVSSGTPPAQAEVPLRVARVSYIEGPVTTQRVQDEEWIDARLNLPLLPGDKFYVGNGARAEIELEDEVILRLAEDSYVTIEALDDTLTRIRLAHGTLVLHAWRVDYPRPPIEIASHHFTAIPGNHANVRFDIAEHGPAEIRVRRGDVRVVPVADAPEFALERGQRAVLAEPGQPGSEIARDGIEDAFDQWCDVRDAARSASRGRHGVTPRISGVQDLDRYGDWIEVPEYGEVWQPRITAIGWAPYRYGRWACRPPFGWIWVADEPWGWVPYHYGRWVCLEPYDWCWVPSGVLVGEVVRIGARPIWYPAVVSFAYLGGRDFVGVSFGGSWWPRPCVGWFPLGPADPFVPWYYPHHVVVSAHTHAICHDAVHVRQLPAVHTPPDGHCYQNVCAADAVTVVPHDDFVGDVYVNRRGITLDRAAARAIKTGPDAVSAMAPADGILTAHRAQRGLIGTGLPPPAAGSAGTRSIPGALITAPLAKVPRGGAPPPGGQTVASARSLTAVQDSTHPSRPEIGPPSDPSESSVLGRRAPAESLSATPMAPARVIDLDRARRALRSPSPSARDPVRQPRHSIARHATPTVRPPASTSARPAPAPRLGDSVGTGTLDAGRRLAERSFARSIGDRSASVPGFSPRSSLGSRPSGIVDLRRSPRDSSTGRPSAVQRGSTRPSPVPSPTRITSRPSSSLRRVTPTLTAPPSRSPSSSSSRSVRVVPRSGSSSRVPSVGRTAPAPAPAPSRSAAPSPRSTKTERRSSSSSSRAAPSIAPARPSAGPPSSSPSPAGADARPTERPSSSSGSKRTRS